MCPTLQLVDGSLVLSQLLVYVILWLAGYDGRCWKTSLRCVFVLWRRTWRFQRYSNVLRLCVRRIEVFWRWTHYGRRTLKEYRTYEMAWINSLHPALNFLRCLGESWGSSVGIATRLWTRGLGARYRQVQEAFEAAQRHLINICITRRVSNVTFLI